MDPIAELEQRIDQVETFSGSSLYLDSDDVVDIKLKELLKEFQELFQFSSDYSKNLWKLLDTFTRSGTCQKYSKDMEQVVISCNDSICCLLDRLYKLDLCYSENIDRIISCGILPLQPLQAKTTLLCDLPQLHTDCNALIIKSLEITQRFIHLNIESNELWNVTEKRLLKLEGRINSILAKHSI